MSAVKDPRIDDYRLTIDDWEFVNPQSSIRNPQFLASFGAH